MNQLSFKIAWRNLYNNKGFTFINLGGLAIGLGACLMLLLYVANEWKYDSQFKDAANIYEVKVNFIDQSNQIMATGDQTPNVLAKNIRAEVPGVQSVGYMSYPVKNLLGTRESSLKVENRFADPEILKIFSLDFIRGSAEKAFEKPNAIILTESLASKLFPNGDALNQNLRFDNSNNLQVTGVIRDLPQNVSYRFESLTSFNENLGLWPKGEQWDNFSFYTFLKLNPNVSPANFNISFKNFLKIHDKESKNETFIYPLLESHLYGSFVNGKPGGGRIQQVRIFIALAIGILIIACINFMNLSTARSLKRAKEVGIRKTIGATRGSLIAQYLLESQIMVYGSLLLAIILVEICLPWMNKLLDLQLSLGTLSVSNWLMIVVAVFFTGLLAGSYPAFYLSAFDPLKTLKSNAKVSNSFAVTFRQVLVVAQFSFAVFLITGTWIINKQLQYIKDRKTGYDPDALVEIPYEGNLLQKFETFKTRLLASGAVTAVCQLSGSIASQNSTTSNLSWSGMPENGSDMGFNQLYTTFDFVKTTGVKLLSGRDFSRRMKTDSTAILLNRTAAMQMKLDHPLGVQVMLNGVNRHVIGIFDDIIWGRPTKREMPMVVGFSGMNSDVVTMRLNQANTISENLAAIAKVSKEINPAYPAEIKFVSHAYEMKIADEKNLAVLSNIFGGFSIFISCLGLLGLSAYSAALRSKEVGIRRVLGATTVNLVQLLSWNFVKMVLVAIVIALPVTYQLMNVWLSKFDFHIHISWWILMSSSVFVMLVAFITVSYQALVTAKANPVEAIRYE